MPRARFSLARAYRHLREHDPVLGALIDVHGPFRPRPSGDAYGELVRAVLYQQLAGAAASAIERRWLALYGANGRTPSPAEILATSDEQFRAAGISRQKTAYLRDIARHAVEGLVDFDTLAAMADDEVIARLTAIHGVGVWTAQMLLLFHLGRPDVLPTGDLGVRQGMRVAYGLAEAPTPKEAERIGAPWAPYRSVGSWYMWRAVSGPPLGA